MSDKTIRAYVLRRVEEQPTLRPVTSSAALVLWWEARVAFPHKIVGWGYFRNLYGEAYHQVRMRQLTGQK